MIFVFVEGEHRLRMFESKVLRKIFGPKRDEVTPEGIGEDYITRSSMICTPPNIIRVVTSRRTRLFRYVASMEDRRHA
jgi:hypothetical protein